MPDNYKRVYLDWMRQHPALVRLAPALVGPPDPGLVRARRRGDRRRVCRSSPARRPRERGIDPDALTPGDGRARHLVQLGAVAVRDPRLARRDRPHLQAFYPTSFLTTAREIIFLWVARMVMMGIEFAGDVPFRDVYVHPVIQAPDGRRMSKSLGTGIDPLDEIDVHGADALRFGLLAMSSTQDVRFSADRVQQGRDLANKMWNASRLILLNAGDAEPAPRTATVEDRWIVSRLAARRSTPSPRRSRATTSPTAGSASTRSSGRSSATGTWRSSSRGSTTATRTRPRTCSTCSSGVLALAHPVMPFVTEEIWSYLPDRRSQLLVVGVPAAGPSPSSTPRPRPRSGGAIELTRRSARWRDLVGVPAGSVLAARIADGRVAVTRVRRPAGPLLASTATTASRCRRSARSRSSPRTRSTPSRRAARIAERSEQLRSEVERAERKLANEGFVAKAPAEVVEAERAEARALPRPSSTSSG